MKTATPQEEKTPDADEFAGAVIELAKDDAIRAGRKITHDDPKVQEYLQGLYQAAFLDGAMHVIKNELEDAIVKQFDGMNRAQRRKAKKAKK